MIRSTRAVVLCGAATLAGICVLDLRAAEKPVVVEGQAAFTDFAHQAPGTFRKITPADLPAPFATESADNGPEVVARPEGAWPKALPGFKVTQYATRFDNPRLILRAPNGDLFLAESGPGRIKVLHGMTADGKAQTVQVFADHLHQPFGIAFYPPGKNPKYVYVGNTNSIVRFPYRNGDLKARGPAETIVPNVPAGGGHWTRSIAFSPDGKKLYVAVGSASNVDDPDTHPAEHERANVLEFTPGGKGRRIYAAGIRNPAGLAVDPITHEVWVSVNERDELGNNLVPDYITHVQEGGFYGWPWYYMGSNQDPRHAGAHPELKGKVLVPDVLLQPHNASLQLTFYDGKQFPREYAGDIFAAEHGSWNRDPRAGYEVIRVPLKDGHASGVYEEFLTGFVTPEGGVWGRPVGVATASDGSLMVTDDGSNTVWRVSYGK